MKHIIRKILTEELNEGVINVSPENLSKAKDLYDYIYKNWDDITEKVGDRDYNNAYIDPKLKEYFLIEDREGRSYEISVGFYMSSERESARADGDTLLLNINAMRDEEDFLDTIEHELVHLMDPFVRFKSKIWLDKKKKNPFISYYEKTGAEEMSSDMSQYPKLQHEYQAFLTTFLTKLKNSVGSNSSKVRELISVIEIIKNSKDKEHAIKNTPQDKKSLFKDYNKFLEWPTYEVIKAWGSKPTMYKDFIKKVYTELTKVRV